MALGDMEEIPVLVNDLRMVMRALNAAYGSQYAQDLAAQYRQMDEAPRPSNLSKALESAHNRIHGYIVEAEKPGEETDDGDN